MFGLFNKTKSFEEISSPEFELKMKSKDTIVLDVRTGGEFASGYIPGAKNIDVNSGDFASRISKLDKSKNYLVYCRSGMRSASACTYLGEQGFENVTNLRGGIMGWKGQVKR
ncbi:MAG: rhodanese-like domain-containing protein [Flavobacteriales bacterium]|jgi:rhodanese-related sulfurtransferase|nr:rhodanese-like domain-containing protein [Flavobacteriales bacterium]NCG30080.1 rhodanese-like domain-containing protein [Bacteroidota bacterium]MBT3963170.1 rhodanese-like domain-containing protein [Flavobacteriales bacterium]MBT4705650.1 rhodanese-like domain-containing protein [Flavobacteriales bacterium]MBT4930926.1 rhodanese-like domain-containing protein [Flavobacteriales bacterium]